MTQPTLSPVLTATSPAERLQALKNLKNSVIGNTWKKVEVAENEPLLRLYAVSRLNGRNLTQQVHQLAVEQGDVGGY